MLYSSVWPFSDREIVLLVTKKDFPNYTRIIAGKSVKFHKCKEMKDPVRAEVDNGSWILKQIDEERTEVIYMQSMNPKLGLPDSMFIKFAIEEQLQIIDEINSHIEECKQKQEYGTQTETSSQKI